MIDVAQPFDLQVDILDVAANQAANCFDLIDAAFLIVVAVLEADPAIDLRQWILDSQFKMVGLRCFSAAGGGVDLFGPSA